jgi:hypothetical protein
MAIVLKCKDSTMVICNFSFLGAFFLFLGDFVFAYVIWESSTSSCVTSKSANDSAILTTHNHNIKYTHCQTPNVH